MPKRHIMKLTAVAAALALSACSDGDSDLAKLDNELTANQSDPALTSALEDQIMVDPSLSQQSNRNAVRPPESPVQGQYPLPQDGQPRRKRAAAAEQGGALGCEPKLDYGMAWARKLPPAFAVYPGARVTEAAGKEAGACRMRVVTFETPAPAHRVVDHYAGRAARAGYSAERQMRAGDHVLAGTDGGDNAFYLIVTPLRNGSDVAIIANNGA